VSDRDIWLTCTGTLLGYTPGYAAGVYSGSILPSPNFALYTKGRIFIAGVRSKNTPKILRKLSYSRSILRE